MSPTKNNKKSSSFVEYITSFFYSNKDDAKQELIDAQVKKVLEYFSNSKFAVMKTAEIVKYIEKISRLQAEGNNLEDIPRLSEYKEFRKANPITIKDAWIVDEFLTNKRGGYWMTAYNSPKEGEFIDFGGCKWQRNVKAVNVGILTFDIE